MAKRLNMKFKQTFEELCYDLFACITGVYLALRKARDTSGERDARGPLALPPRFLALRARLNKRRKFGLSTELIM